MLVFRISPRQYCNDLMGTGAGLYGGRWNPVGTRLLYTAQHRSLALCEMMVNLNNILIKQDYDLVTIEIPDKCPIKKISPNQLPTNWATRMLATETQLVGKTFATENNFLGLEVPSVVIPQESNFLFNPMHADFGKIKIIDQTEFIFDERLF